MPNPYDPRPDPPRDDAGASAHCRRLKRAIAGPGNDITIRRGEVLITQDGDYYETVTLCPGGYLCADGGHITRVVRAKGVEKR